MPTNKARYSITFDPDILDKVEEYWHEHRLKNKNTAINELLRIALADHSAVASDEEHFLDTFRAAPNLARKMVIAALDAATDPDADIPAPDLDSLTNEKTDPPSEESAQAP